MIRGGPELAGSGSPWPKGGQALLMAAAVGPDAQVLEAFERWTRAVDIEAPVDGGTFRLLPLVYDRLKGMAVEHPLMGRLKGVYRRAWYETHQLFHDMAPALAALGEAGVPTLMLKGAPLALTYYKSFAARPMFDLDVVVPADRFEEALGVLAHAGWSMGAMLRAREIADAHGLDLRNAAGRELDLHKHCLRECPSPKADAWFWSSARPFSFQGVETLQPSPTAMLLGTVVHGVRSNVEPSIRWIADALSILKRAGDEIDWPELTRFARAQKLTHRLGLGLAHLQTAYDAPVPSTVLSELSLSGPSLIERIENTVYLGDARLLYKPRLYPLIDYWRFLRNEPLPVFVSRFPSFIARRWGLKHPVLAPVEAVATLGRNLKRAWSGA